MVEAQQLDLCGGNLLDVATRGLADLLEEGLTEPTDIHGGNAYTRPGVGRLDLGQRGCILSQPGLLQPDRNVRSVAKVEMSGPP